MWAWQAMDYDPDGQYVRTWLPELAAIPGKEIHQAKSWPATLCLTLFSDLLVEGRAYA